MLIQAIFYDLNIFFSSIEKNYYILFDFYTSLR